MDAPTITTTRRVEVDANGVTKEIITTVETTIQDGKKRTKTSTKTIATSTKELPAKAVSDPSAVVPALPGATSPNVSVISTISGTIAKGDPGASPVTKAPEVSMTDSEFLTHLKQSKWWLATSGFPWSSLIPHRPRVCGYNLKRSSGQGVDVREFSVLHACGGKSVITVTEKNNNVEIAQEFIKAPSYSRGQIEAFSNRFAAILSAFSKKSLSQKVGDGECWSFVHIALEEAGARQALYFNFGIQIPMEECRAGDIIHFHQCKFEVIQNGQVGHRQVGAPNHVAIISNVVTPSKFAVWEQNYGGKRFVQEGLYDFSSLRDGHAYFWRPVPNS